MVHLLARDRRHLIIGRWRLGSALPHAIDHRAVLWISGDDTLL
jgi:hypothetical protein